MTTKKREHVTYANLEPGDVSLCDDGVAYLIIANIQIKPWLREVLYIILIGNTTTISKIRGANNQPWIADLYVNREKMIS